MVIPNNGYQKNKKLDIVKFKVLEIANRDLKKLRNNVENTVVFAS